jgi:heme-degrading monooxygenase HmoA
LFTAINYITCKPDYRERFEELFTSRVGAIDTMPGFLRMRVLRPQRDGEPYLVLSEWENESSFRKWTDSDEFRRGHARAFDDMKTAREAGREAPMKSRFETYEVITE